MLSKQFVHSLCGGGEIRTHDPVTRVPLFKSGAFNLSSHSSMIPSRLIYNILVYSLDALDTLILSRYFQASF